MDAFWRKWMNQKIHFREIELIPTPITVDVYYCSKDSFNALLHTEYELEEDQFIGKIKGAGAITIFIDNGSRSKIILGVFTNSIHNIAHEATHVSWFLQYLTGFVFNHDNQETQAYFIGYITQEVGRFLKEIT